MPIIAIPRKAVAKYIELERKSREAEDKQDYTSWDIAIRIGFMEALNCLLSSEQVGLIIMEGDCALDGEPGLPKVVIAEDKP